MSTSPPPYGDQGHDNSGQGGSPYGYDPQAQPSDQQRGYQAAPTYSGGQPPNDVDNNLGIIALVTGLVGLLVLPPVAIAGIIFGRKSQAAAAAGRANNGSLGTAGFVLGIIGTILLAIYVVVGILFVIAILGVGVASF